MSVVERGCDALSFFVFFCEIRVPLDPLRNVIITKSTREVLLQTDWCSQLRMATTVPQPQRCSRRLQGKRPLSLSHQQVEKEWSGVSPTPPSGGLPLLGAPPAPLCIRLYSSPYNSCADYMTYMQFLAARSR